MQHAKVFGFVADEDFGMIPIEAQSCGTHVIVYVHGGSLESVNGGKPDSSLMNLLQMQ